MAGAYPESVDRLIAEFSRLPGIGRRSAERLAFYVLKSKKPDAMRLADAVRDVKERVRHCAVCFSFTDDEVCGICDDPRRERSTVLVVEQPKDAIALEMTGMYRGVYHILMGRLNPLEGVGPGDLTVEALVRRVEHAEQNCGGEEVAEIVLGLNPNLEGDGTALYLSERLKECGRGEGVRVSRLARGLPAGSQLEFANKAVLADAIEGRQPME